jgi:putative iron-only hydrogenase system regulator
MRKRVGVVAVMARNRNNSAAAINKIISDHGSLIHGRIGLPFREGASSVIALIVEADTDELGAFTGKLGMLPGVEARTMLFGGPVSSRGEEA